jgi:hypothetical protein
MGDHRAFSLAVDAGQIIDSSGSWRYVQEFSDNELSGSATPHT